MKPVIGGTVWTWPDPPMDERDVIASYFRNWGRPLAYDAADGLIVELAAHGLEIRERKRR
jgi:hypothetical protein